VTCTALQKNRAFAVVKSAKLISVSGVLSYVEEDSEEIKPKPGPWIIAALLIPACLFALFVWPGFPRCLCTSSTDACINNLVQIDGAKQQWALEHNIAETNVVVVTWDNVKPYLGRTSSGEIFYCPEDTTKQYSNSYALGDLKTPPKCKINPAHVLP
jgi:hypothetical protein